MSHGAGRRANLRVTREPRSSQAHVAGAHLGVAEVAVGRHQARQLDRVQGAGGPSEGQHGLVQHHGQQQAREEPAWQVNNLVLEQAAVRAWWQVLSVGCLCTATSPGPVRVLQRMRCGGARLTRVA